MGTKGFKPTSAARRFMTVSDFAEVTRSTPERSLVVVLKKSGGRNNRGRITVRHHGGGHKRRYRLIDFRRDKVNVPGKVAQIEYDPNRSARIALIHFADGEKRYILHPVGLSVGDSVVTSDEADIKPGNCLKLVSIPLGTFVHNVELSNGRGGQLCRSAGSYAQVMAKRRVRSPSLALRRAAQRMGSKPGDDRPGGQHRARKRHHRQGRSFSLEGNSPDRPRYRDEPGRPSARWW